mgnify:CR=1 FL=1
MLNEKLKNLPENSGIYLMKNKDGIVIYVGKAINLKNRIKSYFTNIGAHDVKTRLLVANIVDLDYIITNNEAEALLLESALIKKYRPHYNIMLKDDKSYPYIKFTLADQYPMLKITREYKKDGSKYYGPYTNALSARKSIEIINKLYPIKMCNKRIGVQTKKEKRPCINCDIGLCVGPCAKKIDNTQYMVWIEEIDRILSGSFDILIGQIEQKMLAASAHQEYEAAAAYRDYIFAVNDITQTQKITVADSTRSDVFALARHGDSACVAMFERDQGSLSEKKTFMLEGTAENSDERIITEFVKQYYTTDVVIPKTVMLQYALLDEERGAIEEMLSEKKKSKVHILVPQKGEKKRLVEMLNLNAVNALAEYNRRQENAARREREAMEELQSVLKLERPIQRMEAFDISNIAGSDNVGAMVVYEKTQRTKKAYRRFSIKEVEGQDDYAATAEVVYRRLKRASDEMAREKEDANMKFLPLPDIIFADGGKGHRQIIQSIVDTFGYDIVVAGLKKDNRHRLCALVTQDEEYELRQLRACSKLLNEISEEVHRYAHEYHSVVRRKNLLASELTEITGIGPKRRAALMAHFKSLDKIKTASVEEIGCVDGVGAVAAQNIADYFQKEAP